MRITLLLAVLGLGCAASIQAEVESVGTLQSVNGSSYVQSVHHDAPPSEQALTLAVKREAVRQNATRHEADAPVAVRKEAHGF